MFDLTYGLNKVSSHESFEFTFIDLYDRLKSEDGLSYQFLETMIWIEERDSFNPIFFYDARDAAHRLGVLDSKGNVTQKFREAYNNRDLSVLRSIPFRCPTCSSDNILRVTPFEYVWKCNECETEFQKGEL